MKTNIDREIIVNLLLNTLETHFDEINELVDLSERENIKLFGGDGLLDSIGLVSFVVEVEERLEDEFDVSVVLADEKAMSRRTSPFARISYLADYILEVVNEDSNG
jgi:acyl carrier protein